MREPKPDESRVLTEEEIEKIVGNWINESCSARSTSLNRGHWEDIPPIIAQAQRDLTASIKDAECQQRVEEGRQKERREIIQWIKDMGGNEHLIAKLNNDMVIKALECGGQALKKQKGINGK